MNDGPTISEAEILSRQAAEAKASAIEALNLAKAALQKNMDPRPVVREHPWMAIASASVAAFVAVLLTVPSKEERELQRLERINRATHPTPPPPGGNGEAHGNGHSVPPKSTIWTSIIHEVVQLVRPILMTAITSSMNGRTAPPPDRQNPNNPF